ncbi:hypothetical protein L596_028396 [Steinernema carpocapsae]|uniref:Uncharacterized protein n=1 Tax=Steinernema carpocapsae TaxID=34508 RepID=A0A4U5LYC2_STECR|nr:hypothetical protein L596_028396 [Steinernema carpocapsae]
METHKDHFGTSLRIGNEWSTERRSRRLSIERGLTPTLVFATCFQEESPGIAASTIVLIKCTNSPRYRAKRTRGSERKSGGNDWPPPNARSPVAIRRRRPHADHRVPLVSLSHSRFHRIGDANSSSASFTSSSASLFSSSAFLSSPAYLPSSLLSMRSSCVILTGPTFISRCFPP